MKCDWSNAMLCQRNAAGNADEMLQEIKRNRIEMVVLVGYVVLNLVSLFVVLGQGTSRTLLLSLATTLGFLVLWFWKIRV